MTLGPLKFGRKILIRLLLITYLLSTLAWLLCLSAYYIPPATWKLPVVFCFGFLLLLIPQFLLLVWGLLKRRRWAVWLPLVSLLAGIPQLRASYQLGFLQGNRVSAPTQQLSVTSYNVKRFHNLPIRNKKEFSRLIKDVHFHKNLKADVICFQESFGYRKQVLNHVLKEVDYPYHFSNFYGNTIFSKYPIIREHFDPLTNKNNGLIYVDIVKGNDTIRVFDIHLQSLHFGDAQFDAISDPLSNDRRTVRTLFGKIARGSVERQKQVSIVERYLAESPYPVILCADLNAPPTSYSYRQLTSGGLRDGFVAAGRGLSPTYAGPIPGLRIDYIFTDPSFGVKRYWVDYEEEYSDHYPVKVVLEW